MATKNLGGGNVTVTLALNNTTVTAGNGNDTITVNGNSNIINVGNGNDVIIGTGNNNRIIAGNGMDTIILMGQNEWVTVGNGNDVITITGNNETVNAGNGNDIVNIIGSSTSLIGTCDKISLGNGDDVINLSGTTYNNVVTVGNGTDTINISGTSNNDSIFIGNGNDTINITGTTSNDIIMGGGGSAHWVGGAIGHWADKAGHIAGGGTGRHFGGGSAGGAQGNNIINISGVTQNDLIVLGNGDNKVNISAQSNQDIVIAGNGNNVINISAQGYNDMVILGNGNNYVNDVGTSNSVYVGNGNNTVVYNPADVIIQAGNGFNSLLITSHQSAPIDFVHNHNVHNFQMIDLTGSGLRNANGFGNVLNLDDNAVDTLAGKNNIATKTHETLIVLAGSSDIVNIGLGWHNITPAIEAPILITENLLSNTGSIVATPITLSYYQVFAQGDDTLIINNYLINTPPVAVADTYTVTETAGQIYPLLLSTGNVLFNDTSSIGRSLTVSALDGHALVGGSYTETLANGNSITLNANGSFSYVIHTPINGSDVFHYTATDGLLTSSAVAVTFNVSDTAPVAVADTFAVTEAAGQAYPLITTGNVLVNDLAGGGNTLTVSALDGHALVGGSYTETLADGNSITLNANGSFSYVIHTPINGSDVFHYTAMDGLLTSSAVAVTFNVSDTAPVAVSDTFAVMEAAGQAYPLITTGNVLVNDLAGGGNTLTVSALDGHALVGGSYTETLADGNSITLNADGSFVETINNPINGSDVFTYTTTDGLLVSNAATVTFNVSDTAPVAIADTFAVTEAAGQAYPLITTGNVLVNDLAGGGNTLTVSALDGHALVGGSYTETLADGNSITLNADGSFIETINAAMNARDTFSYTITDGLLTSNSSVITFKVSYIGQIIENTSFTLFNAKGATSGDVLSVGNVQAQNGNAILNADESVTYVPTTDFVGTGSFSYIVTDETTQQSTLESMNVIVGPASQTLSETMVEGMAFTLANATGATSGDALSLSLATGAADGAVTFNGNALTYTPNAGFVGSDSFTYLVTDPLTSQSATDTMNVIVGPAVQILSNITLQETPLTISNATGATSGDVLSLSIASNASNGVVTFNGNALTYTPNAGFVGNDSFTYLVTDSLTNQSVTDTVNMAVIAAPQAQSISHNSILGYGIALSANTLFGTNNTNNGASWSIVINSTTGGLTAIQSGSDWIIQNPNQSSGNQTITYTVTETLNGESSSTSNTLSVNYSAPNISVVEGGFYFSNLVDSASRIYSWGLNSSETLGNGNTNTSYVSLTPVPLDWVHSARGSAPTSILSLADGNGHALAVINGNLLYGWGANQNYEIDAGASITQTPFPVQAIGPGGTGFLKNIVQVSTDGSGFSAALDSGGHVWDWGFNRWGNLGIGTTVTQPYPVEVLVNSTTPLDNITEVAVNQGVGSNSFVLALDSSGRVWDWGDNTYGELGLGSTTQHPYAVEVPNLGVSTPIIKVAAGDLSSFALDAGGHVWAWGYNGDGSLGIGSTTNALSPVEVKGQGGIGFLSNIIDIQAGGVSGMNDFTTALDSSGHVWSWGNAMSGVLGNGATSGIYTTPVEVLTAANHPLNNIVAIMNTEVNEFALDSSGHIWAWGYNANGVLGNQNSTGQAYAIDVTNKLNSGSLFTTQNLNFVNLALNNAHTGIEISGSDNVIGGVNETMAFNPSTNYLIFRIAENQSNALTTQGASVTAQDLDSIATFKSALGGTATEIDFNGGGSLTLTGVDPTTHHNFESLVHVLAAVTII
jgi:alpha-tubulin suppressor-like RCC1 family protein